MVTDGFATGDGSGFARVYGAKVFTAKNHFLTVCSRQYRSNRAGDFDRTDPRGQRVSSREIIENSCYCASVGIEISLKREFVSVLFSLLDPKRDEEMTTFSFVYDFNRSTVSFCIRLVRIIYGIKCT